MNETGDLMQSIKLSIHIPSEDVETMSDYLFYLGSSGVEIKDRLTFTEVHPDKYGEIYALDEADYPKDGALVIAYFDDSFSLHSLKEEVLHITVNNGITIIDDSLIFEIVDLDDDDESWKQAHHEIKINESLSIIPSWFDDIPSKLTIKIDPGLGFGTGSHPTTKMCLSLLPTYVKASDTVIDIGTGSGILAILAAKLTEKPVYGVDLDAEALGNATYNALLNGVERILFTTDITEINDQADLIVMNIVYPIIKALLSEVRDYLKPEGILMLSGITTEEYIACTDMLKDAHYTIIEEQTDGGFVSFVCQRIGD